LGERVASMISVLCGRYHLSKRDIRGILKDFFGLEVSLGTVSKTEARVSKALAGPVEQARQFVKQQRVVHADETGHKIAGQKAWLWTAVTDRVSVFLLRPGRGSKAAKSLLGGTFNGILVSDRWCGYNWLKPPRRQLCFAHLLRDFKKISERPGESSRIGKALVAQTKKMFRLWHQVRDGPLDRDRFRQEMTPIQEKVETLLRRGVSCGNPKTKKTCKNLLKLKASLWTFVKVTGVEPTNNTAERAIRPFVLWRRVSFGTQGERGNRFVERMLTVVTTCKQQRRNVLEYISSAIEAHLRGEASPSLLPIEVTRELGLVA